jgi:hypothetical protein
LGGVKQIKDEEKREEHLNKFLANRNNKGAPRKLFSKALGLGYTKSEAISTIEVLLTFTEKELATVLATEEATILEKIVAKALVKSYEKGSLYSIETLFNRVYGLPKQSIETSEIEKPIFKQLDITVINATDDHSTK